MSRNSKYLKIIYDKYYKIHDEGIENNSVHMSFPQYVALVQTFFDRYINDKKWKKNPEERPVIFTALCITPFQWFNFDITPKEGKKTTEIVNISDISSMHANEHWSDYHNYLINYRCDHYFYDKLTGKGKCKRLQGTQDCIKKGVLHNILRELGARPCNNVVDQTKFKIYRCLLTLDTKKKKSRIYERVNFPDTKVVEKQLKNHYIGINNSGEFLLDSSEFTKLDLPYEIELNEKAYLIVDEKEKNKINEISNRTYHFIKLERFFKNLFQNPVHSKLNFKLDDNKYRTIVRNQLPEDFIIFGYKNNSYVKWEFAIASDVAIEKHYTEVKFLFDGGNDQPIFVNLYNLVEEILLEF